ncbi:MAG: AI-2E family transporter [Saprospiraceae bacterium]|uniref:AI-2E family transporter n=1 Tax=Candidatus Defluviibacterium haderslevense TaxID=2981993 RepID=A0A9D7SAC1_9BACT|nr:AI-2E family transporter [Candidatus Defluviibacterium haderslevense]MBK9718148.1 AI-2E family transporter [Candidatus Defluviibacterium haderslevense]MBL0237130.1 AI-2E family transporter [Candidatus Defluviibacterium haderslevense]
MNLTLKLPLYAKFSLISIGVLAVIFMLFVGQGIILPLLYAIIFAILLNPMVNFIVGKGLNRNVSIFIAVLTAILIVVLLLYLISGQLSLFSDTYPQLKIKFNESLVQLINWISDRFSIKKSAINKWISQNQIEAIDNLGGTIGHTLFLINGILIIVILIPVYIVLLLYYKVLILEFVHKLFVVEHHTTLNNIFFNSKKIIQGYLTGLLFEMVIIAILNSIGLLILGIDYAIVLGITGAIINIIPYIGGVIAIALPMIIAFITKDSATYPIMVFLVYLLIQFIDNHFIIPHIVASKVKINGLVCVIVVLLGGAIWGIPGMFLSIPITAILKVVLDHTMAYKHWGALMGNIVPTTKVKLNFKKKKILT